MKFPAPRSSIVCALIFGLVSFEASTPAAQPPKREREREKEKTSWRIAIIVDGVRQGDTPRVEDIFTNEINDVVRGDQSNEIVVAKDKLRVAGWTPASVKAELERLLGDSEVDMVVALGFISSNEVARRGSLPKPAFAAHLLDAELQGVKIQNGTSGKKNMTFVVAPDILLHDFKAIANVIPKKRIAVIAGKNVLAGIAKLSEGLKSRASQAGLDAVVIPVGSTPADVSAALGSIPKDVSAAYVALVEELTEPGFTELTKGLAAMKLPSFSLRGRIDVERGIMATISPKQDDQQRARRVALNILRAASGDPLGAFPVTVVRSEGFLVNMAVARAIDFFPTWDILNEAEVLNPGADDRTAQIRRVTMRIAAEEAIKANLDLMADQSKVDFADDAVPKARALLLPQIEASATAATLDKDRAFAGYGLYPERSLAGEITGRQIIFAEKAWANLAIQGDVHLAKAAKHEVLKLDIASEAATAYINVLRAKMLERIRVENLKKTRQNLELARVRSSVGSAASAEVYRWDNQLANDRRAVLSANATVNAAQIQLNRLLHHPLEETFITQAATMEGSELGITPEKIAPFIDNPKSFAIFRQFMTEEALAHTPELMALDKVIAANERAVTSGRASLFLPTLGVEAGIKHYFIRDGVGAEGAAPIHLGPLNVILPNIGPTTWQAGMRLSFPIFSGLGDYAELEQREAALARYQREREAAAEKIEQRMRTMLHLAAASYMGIKLAQDSADAARKGLEIVTAAYAQGSLGVLDLLDAQNAGLISEQLVAGAVHDSLIDQINVQRAVGWLAFLASPEDANAFLTKATKYLEAHGAKATP